MIDSLGITPADVALIVGFGQMGFIAWGISVMRESNRDRKESTHVLMTALERQGAALERMGKGIEAMGKGIEVMIERTAPAK